MVVLLHLNLLSPGRIQTRRYGRFKALPYLGTYVRNGWERWAVAGVPLSWGVQCPLETCDTGLIRTQAAAPRKEFPPVVLSLPCAVTDGFGLPQSS